MLHVYSSLIMRFRKIYLIMSFLTIKLLPLLPQYCKNPPPPFLRLAVNIKITFINMFNKIMVKMWNI